MGIGIINQKFISKTALPYKPKDRTSSQVRSYSVDKPIIKAHAVKYFTILASHQPLQNRTIPPAFRNANIYMHDTLSHSHYPSPRTTTLASLVKGEVLSPEKIRATTGGIVTPPTLPKPHYLPRFS